MATPPTTCANPLTPITDCSPTASTGCLSINNLVDETVLVTGNINGTSVCFYAPSNPTGSASGVVTVSVAVPSAWTVVGQDTGKQYFNQYMLNGTQTLNITDTPAFIAYSQHRTVPWLVFAIVATIAAIFVAFWGMAINRNARADVCQRFPDLCKTITHTNPQNGRTVVRGYPEGFRKNNWQLPAFVLVGVATVFWLGYAASRGAFGFSTLGWTACNERRGGWVWTTLNTGWGVPVMRATGLGKCANTIDQSNCFVYAKTVNPAFAYNEPKAQSPNEAVYPCACVDTTNPTQSVECLSSQGNAPCATCASAQ